MLQGRSEETPCKTHSSTTTFSPSTCFRGAHKTIKVLAYTRRSAKADQCSLALQLDFSSR
eukprot:764804-Hanusia_phi.AAC.3